MSALAVAPSVLLRELGHALSCTLLPSCCALCGGLIPHLSEAPICNACWSELPAQREHCCARCGEDLFKSKLNAAEPAYCRACRLAPPAFTRAVSFGVYDGAMRGAIHALKYQRMAPLARRLAVLLARSVLQLADHPNDQKPMLVVPVPLHRSRMGERGFNQALKLASETVRVIAKTNPRWKLKLSPRTLVRKRLTESQAGLSPRQRRLNLRGAFFVPEPDSVHDRHILLVDDIYTTGATARACSKVLMDAGAASVTVATLARAQRRFPAVGREVNSVGVASNAPISVQ